MVLDFVYLLVDLCVFSVNNALTCIFDVTWEQHIEQPSLKDIYLGI